MADLSALMARASEAAEAALPARREEKKRILVVTHIDADGLSSGSIAFQALCEDAGRSPPSGPYPTWTSGR